MIDASFVDKPFHGFGDVVRVRAVQLQTSRRFLGSEVCELECFLSPVDEGAGIDHFTDVEARPELLTDESERVIRDTRHWCQHDWRPDRYGPDTNRPEFSWLGKFHIGV